ncbi:MAG: LysR family transcriptional regulator [Hyphomicrobiales bacterium]|nr:LysR family transcriptional regulator [Hyphomicrobiales bacterium]
MKLTFRHLEMLVAVVDAGNFSRAADRLSISQPAFSEAIRKIEYEVGHLLFERTTRSLTLTAEGRRIVAIARETVRDYKLALENIRSQAGGGKGHLSIAALPSIVSAAMPAVLKEFGEQFPDCGISIHDVPHERAVALVVEGSADMAITIIPGKADGLLFDDIAADRFFLLCEKDHRLARGNPVRWRDIAGVPFISMTGLSSIRRVTDAAFLSADVTPQIRCEVEQIASAVALVHSGYGVTALPMLASQIFAGRDIAVRRLIEPVGHRRIGIVTRSGRALSSAARHMMKIIAGQLKLALANDLHRAVRRPW